MCHIDYISLMYVRFLYKCEKSPHLTSELVTSTEYMATIESHHSPPPPPPPLFLLLTLGGGVRRVRSVDEADCARVSEAAVFAEEEREAVSLRIRPACLACLAL